MFLFCADCYRRDLHCCAAIPPSCGWRARRRRRPALAPAHPARHSAEFHIREQERKQLLPRKLPKVFILAHTVSFLSKRHANIYKCYLQSKLAKTSFGAQKIIISETMAHLLLIFGLMLNARF